MNNIEYLAEKYFLSWNDIENDTIQLAKQLPTDKDTNLVCISRGGLVVGQLVGYYLGIKKIHSIALHSYKEDKSGTNERLELLTPFLPNYCKDQNYIFLDDVNDTAQTMKFVCDMAQMRNLTFSYATIYQKNNLGAVPDYHTRAFDPDVWLVFPWDTIKEK